MGESMSTAATSMRGTITSRTSLSLKSKMDCDHLLLLVLDHRLFVGDVEQETEAIFAQENALGGRAFRNRATADAPQQRRDRRENHREESDDRGQPDRGLLFLVDHPRAAEDLDQQHRKDRGGQPPAQPLVIPVRARKENGPDDHRGARQHLRDHQRGEQPRGLAEQDLRELAATVLPGDDLSQLVSVNRREGHFGRRG